MYVQGILVSCLFYISLITSCAHGRNLKKHRHNKQGRRFLEQLSSEWSSQGGLYPAVLDVALTSRVEANATCGELGPEEYCREMPAKSRWGGMCGICDGPTGSPSRRHPPEHAIDGDPNTWWQSPSLLQGEQYQRVTFTITLQDEMEVVYVIIKSGPSPRPAAWLLELSSLDDNDWRVAKAFARDSEECEILWGLKGPKEKRKKRKPRSGQTEPECNIKFSSPKPLENGEIHVPIGDGGIGVNAKRIRLVFGGLHSASTTDRQFYTLRAVTVAARCQCNGHADSCTIVDGSTQCSCSHNTCGDRCEHCCDGGDWTPIKECEPCPCADRSLSCLITLEGYQCLNCTENRTGPQCDFCIPGYYSLIEGGPCISCDCHPSGSTGNCFVNADQTPICECNPGYTGVLCDTCADGFTGFPECTACACDSRGSIDAGTTCEKPCRCKAFVAGESCNHCLPGYYGLSEALLEGCRECYCSGVTSDCSSSSEPSKSHSFSLGWQASDLSGEISVNPPVDDDGNPFIAFIEELNDVESFYWSSNNEFVGDHLDSYDSTLVIHIKWRVMRGDSSGEPIKGPDVIFVGANGRKMAFGDRKYYNSGEIIEIAVPLIENGWYEIPNDIRDISDNSYRGNNITKFNFMNTLSNLHRVLIRAKFHSDQTEVLLKRVEIIGGNEISVEHCSCPPGHVGYSCQECASGYRKLNSIGTDLSSTKSFECILCDCNGHTSSCSEDGSCGTCEHNTTGERCERCLPGFYGNPLNGTPEDCKPCACPLLEFTNNFSPNCALADLDSDEYVCTQCPDGYVGDHCETCDYGYWGSPTTPGYGCLPCSCDGGPCDTETGECVSCPAHTTGFRCTACVDGYWRTKTLTSPCVPCDCGIGSLASSCDSETGQCVCGPKYTGRACDVCIEGRGNASAGCPTCSCPDVGSVSAVCDPKTGECDCVYGVAKPFCSECDEGFYGFDFDGCKSCNCNSIGSLSSSCDIKTGQCRCKPHVTGIKCDTCEDGYWNLTKDGCKPCPCDQAGSKLSCNKTTGACSCKPGVGGARCHQCLTGYYGFSPSGCLSCPPCGDNHVCDPKTGRCGCLPLTMGSTCKTCRPGSYGYTPGLGCTPCECSPQGSIDNICSVISGQCKCKNGWEGRRCEICTKGRYGPRCKPCGCSTVGTIGDYCSDDGSLCDCNENGQCPCKDNVIGLKCDSCRNGTFGLSSWKQTGCTQCYCFGRSSHCTQAGLTRTQIRILGSRHLEFVTVRHANHKYEIQNLRSEFNVIKIPGTIGDVTLTSEVLSRIHDAPLYWELGERFHGDRVTSYGGMLKFAATDEGEQEYPKNILEEYPLVQIRSQGSLVLDYYAEHEKNNTTYEIRIHESLWRLRSLTGKSSSGISRAGMMIALQDVQQIFVRATTHAVPMSAMLKNASLDSALEIEGRPPPLADGVEMCSCPLPYGSSSCQEAAPGYWMPNKKIFTNESSGSVTIHIHNEAEPCRCNGRSNICDRISGHCLNCSENTGGPNCQFCAEGFFGTPDSIQGCQPCPCPNIFENRAESCSQYPDGTIKCNCKAGYRGNSCELCDVGWRRNGHVCVACECGSGALDKDCDNTGQCRCREFVTGLKCDVCKKPRHYLQGHACAICDNCSQTLLDLLEELTTFFRNEIDPFDLIDIPPPQPYLNNITDKVNSLSHRVLGIIRISNAIGTFSPEFFNGFSLILDNQYKKALQLKGKSENLKDKADRFRIESESVRERIHQIYKKLENKIMDLEDFAVSERHLNVHRALKEAANILRKIKEIDFIYRLAEANQVFDRANLQSTVINEYIYRLNDSDNKVSEINERLDSWHEKSDDIKRLADRVWEIVDIIAAFTKETNKKLTLLNDKRLRSRIIGEEIAKISSKNRTEDSIKAINYIKNAVTKLIRLKKNMNNLTNEIHKRIGIENQSMLKTNIEDFGQIENHLANLTGLANQYKSLFSDTLGSADAAVRATSAYSEITNFVRKANDIIIKAFAAAGRAKHDASVLPQRAAASQKDSQKLLDKAKKFTDVMNNIKGELERASQQVETISIDIRSIGWKDRELSATSSGLTGISVEDILSASNEKSKRIYENMRVLYEEVDNIQQLIRYQLQPRLQELRSQGDDIIGGAEEHVSQIRSNIKKSNVLASSLLEAARLRSDEELQANFSLFSKINELKQKIARAKHAADGIKISLTSGDGGKCVRAYEVPKPIVSTTNRIELDVSFNVEPIKDSILFFIQTKKGDSMKIEVLNKRIHFSWKVDGGMSSVTFPEDVVAMNEYEHIWYRIFATRIWGTGRLLVNKNLHMNGTQNRDKEVFNATNEVSSGFIRIQTNDYIWIGGTGDKIKSNHGLAACIQQVTIDDQRIGLWNFHTQPEGASCVGCNEGVDSAQSSDELRMYYFNGVGYAEFSRSSTQPYNRRQFSISLAFRTFDEDAFLFMAVDQVNNRSVSLSLRSCRVVFRVEYGPQWALEIVSRERHCHGRRVQVRAARVFLKNKLEKGILRVGSEETFGSPVPPVVSPASLPELTGKYWLGGLPPSANETNAPPPILGCLGDLLVDQEGLDPFKTSDHFGVGRTCSGRLLTTVGFKGDGYVEMESQPLNRRSQFGFAFRTHQENAMLLFANPLSVPNEANESDNEVVSDYGLTTEAFDNNPNIEHHKSGFYSVSLVRGEPLVLLSAGKGILKLTGNHTKVNDGGFHSLQVFKSGRKFDLFVNGKAISHGSLAGSGTGFVIKGSLYIGGLPKLLNNTEVLQNKVVGTTALIGSIKDLVFDTNLIPFNSLKSSHKAQIGRLGPLISNDQETQPQTSNDENDIVGETLTCPKPPTYTVEPGAIRFGDTKSSFTAIRIPPRTSWMNEFSISFQFRTYYPNGLIFYVPGSKQKPKHSIAVYLREGRLILSVRARRRREVTGGTSRPGDWRKVSMRAERGRLIMIVGGRETSVRLPRRLTLQHTLYLAGLPEKNILPTAPEMFWKLGGLRGCIRRLQINGRSDEVLREATHHNVGQCSPNIERGAHFPGDAYAVWSPQFSLDSHMELHMEFRTFEKNGVLLSTGQTTSANLQMTLELLNGEVVLSMWRRGSRTLRVQGGMLDEVGDNIACGRWHTISALYTHSTLSLRLDDHAARADEDRVQHSTITSTTITPLYVGGLPDGAQNTVLSTRENFKGCVRNLMINGQENDWIDMDQIHDVIVSSCPAYD